jgi:cysteine desulfurase
MMPYLKDEFANPSSVYGAARRTRQALDEARAVVAHILGAKPTEVVFTASGSESINLAIQGTIYPQPQGSNWVTTSIEHDAVLAQREPLERAGYPCTTVPVRSNGMVDPAAITDAINDQTVLVSVQLVNNEIGTIQPITQIAQAIAEIRKDRAERNIAFPLYLHTDAVAAANYSDLSVARLGVDLLSLSGSKIYGPKGTGILYVRTGTEIEALIWGGGQERNRRSGTENVAGAVGFAAAVELAHELRLSEISRHNGMRTDLMAALEKQIPDIIWNGTAQRQSPGTINLTIPGIEGQALVLYLDKAGIQASTGSACSSGDLDPSHVLLAIGRSREEATSSLRLTLGRGTTQEQLDRLIDVLPDIVTRLRQLS